ncbi:MAG: VacB/RNase II family 3'-5' exoribonuclease [Gemmatimonadaceae bacterium]|nr:VacB/RNase II family 3'-5' exoribonuclease [Gloeobacterales cyanobacterium ES-bin-141]
MNFTLYDLLKLLPPDKWVAAKVLEQKLNLSDTDQRERFALVLLALEKVGVIEKKQGRYRYIVQEDLVAGRLRCSAKGFCFVVSEEAEETYIAEGELKTAWNGDRVLVRVLKKGSRRRKPEGEVILVTERANPVVIGKLVAREVGDWKLIPLDERLNSAIELDDVDVEARDGQIGQVAISLYPLGRRPARGRIVQLLGNVNDPQVNFDLVCSRYDLSLPWSDAVLQEQTPRPELNEAILVGREDWRGHQLFCLPGNYAQMAVSLGELPSGWELGLHISDLTPYVLPGSELDRSASQRACAVDLEPYRVTLWPDELVESCAFVPHQDRLAWSVLVQLDAEAQVLSYRWTPSVVRIEQCLDAENPMPEPLRDVARLLWTGGINFTEDAPEIFVTLLEGLLGEHLTQLNLSAPYQTQADPQWSDLQDWLRLARACGLAVPELTGEDERSAPEPGHYRQWFAQSAHPALQESLLATLPVVGYAPIPAPYFSRARGHVVSFGAPLERYADLLAQRVLVDVLEEGRDRKTSRNKIGVDLRSSLSHGQIGWQVLPPKQQKSWEQTFTVLPHLQERHTQAAQARKDWLGYQKMNQLSSKLVDLQGLITGVQSYGFFVAVEEPYVEGLVHVSQLTDDWYTYQAREPALIGRRNRKRYQIGDQVQVKVKSIDYYRQQVDLTVILEEQEGGLEPQDETLVVSPDEPATGREVTGSDENEASLVSPEITPQDAAHEHSGGLGK